MSILHQDAAGRKSEARPQALRASHSSIDAAIFWTIQSVATASQRRLLNTTRYCNKQDHSSTAKEGTHTKALTRRHSHEGTKKNR